MTPEERKLLEDQGWTIECESPLEIRDINSSRATGDAAEIILLYHQERKEEVSVDTIQLNCKWIKKSCTFLEGLSYALPPDSGGARMRSQVENIKGCIKRIEGALHDTRESTQAE